MRNAYESKYYQPQHTRSRAVVSSTFLTLLVVFGAIFLLGVLIFWGGSMASAENFRGKIERTLSNKYKSYEGVHNKGEESNKSYLYVVDRIECSSGEVFTDVRLIYHEDYLSDPTLSGLPDCR